MLRLRSLAFCCPKFKSLTKNLFEPLKKIIGVHGGYEYGVDDTYTRTCTHAYSHCIVPTPYLFNFFFNFLYLYSLPKGQVF